MDWYFYLLISIGVILILILSITYISFKMAFYSKNKPNENNEIKLPDEDIYNKYKDVIINDITEARKLPFKEFSIKSFDGLTLYGKYFEFKKDATIEIMFHGYRGNGERDLSTGIKRAFACGRNALIIDQRASGKSEGHIISFGINERHDCISWVNKVISELGNDVKIILTGISMGAATVLMASNMNLPKNVIGILADCGYNKPSDIIKKVIKDKKLPANLLYPFVKLAARLFGKFNLEETSPFEAVKNAKVPIIFIHGDDDTFVPCYMSEKLYNACNNKKQLVIIHDAQHGISYLKDPVKYIDALNDFFSNN